MQVEYFSQLGQKFNLADGVVQVANNPASNRMVAVIKIDDIKSHFFIRMSGLHRGHDIILQPGRKYYLNFYFVLMVLLANFTHVRVGSFSGFESSCTITVKATFAIITNLSAPCFEYGITHLLGTISGRKSEQLS